jgi:hypothetical protein
MRANTSSNNTGRHSSRHPAFQSKIIGPDAPFIGEPGPRLLELSHAVGPVGAAALRLMRPHGDDGVDCPFPVGLRPGRVLDADRPDLDLITIVFQDDAVDLGAQLPWSDLRR